MSFKRISERKRTLEISKSLIKNENYLEQMKTIIKNVPDNLDQDKIVDPQFRWEYFKYETRKVFHSFFKRYCAKYKN